LVCIGIADTSNELVTNPSLKKVYTMADRNFNPATHLWGFYGGIESGHLCSYVAGYKWKFFATRWLAFIRHIEIV
jgi:hypothetical protein